MLTGSAMGTEVRARAACALLAALLAAAPVEASAATRAAKGAPKPAPSRSTSGPVAPTASTPPSAAAAPTPGTPAAHPEPAAAPRTAGVVVSVTARRAYLDAGSSEGLAAGQAVALERRGRAVASCRVEAITDHHAVCVGEGVLPGDRFRLQRAGAEAQATGPASSPGSTPSADTAAAGRAPASGAPEFERRRSSLLASPFAPVAFAGPAAVDSPALRLKSEIGLSNVGWYAFGDAAHGFNGERVDLYLRGAELGNGVRLYVDMTAVQWTHRPSDALYRPGTQSMLFVRETAVSAREVGLPYTLAAGRIRPWGIPGFIALDGVQAAWRSTSGDVEAGVFGGAIPDVITLSPAKAYATGGYYALDSAATGAARWIHHEARLSVLGAPNIKQSVEAEALAQGVYGAFDGGADLLASIAGPQGAGLSGARFDVGARAAQQLRLNAGYRYAGAVDPGLAMIRGMQYAGRGHHADLSSRYDVSSNLGLGVVADYAQDTDLAMKRGGLGPELYLPMAFGGRAAFSFGYLEEFGWLSGRSAFVQAVGMPFGIRALARLSWFQDTPSGGPSNHDVGLFLNAQAPILPWLSVRGSALTRVGISSAENSVPGGLQLDLGLRGEI